MDKRQFIIFTFVLLALVFYCPHTYANETSNDAKLNLEGVVLLLDLIDTIIEQNPDHEAVAGKLAEMDEESRRLLLGQKSEANAANPAIVEKINALVQSTAYRLYYSQFRNADENTHRRIFFALPYQAINSPADIAGNYLELCTHRDAFEEWSTGALAKIDLEKCRSGALQWLPGGEHSVPTTYFIYDGNGDAFARFGSVCFDLFGLVMGKRPRATRFDNLAEVGVETIELVLAHEFHHVFSSPYLYPSARKFPTWQAKWKDRIVRQVVSEGVAMRCDVRAGMRRDNMEDVVTVGYWIVQLNEKFAALDDGTITEEEMQKWFGASFHDTARDLLKDYLKRTYPNEDQDELLRANSSSRPSFIYTMGWWMISQIIENGAGKDAAIGLLSQPHDLFSLYNSSLSPDQAVLRVDAGIIE